MENIDTYEREKIARTLRDALYLTILIRVYLEEIDKADKDNIMIVDREYLGWIRGPGAPAGPDNDTLKLCRLFESGLTTIENHFVNIGKTEWLKEREEAFSDENLTNS